MKKLTAFSAVAVAGLLLLAVPVFAHGTGGSSGGYKNDGHMMGWMMGGGMMHSQAYSDMAPADRDAMHKEMEAVVKKWIPNFSMNDSKGGYKGEDCPHDYDKGKQ